MAWILRQSVVLSGNEGRGVWLFTSDGYDDAPDVLITTSLSLTANIGFVGNACKFWFDNGIRILVDTAPVWQFVNSRCIISTPTDSGFYGAENGVGWGFHASPRLGDCTVSFYTDSSSG